MSRVGGGGAHLLLPNEQASSVPSRECAPLGDRACLPLRPGQTAGRGGFKSARAARPADPRGATVSRASPRTPQSRRSEGGDFFGRDRPPNPSNSQVEGGGDVSRGLHQAPAARSLPPLPISEVVPEQPIGKPNRHGYRNKTCLREVPAKHVVND